jgi:hypothetical protein
MAREQVQDPRLVKSELKLLAQKPRGLDLVLIYMPPWKLVGSGVLLLR